MTHESGHASACNAYFGKECNCAVGEAKHLREWAREVLTKIVEADSPKDMLYTAEKALEKLTGARP